MYIIRSAVIIFLVHLSIKSDISAQNSDIGRRKDRIPPLYHLNI